MKHPHERYSSDVAGMPCFAALDEFVIYISEENMRDAVPQDDENCAIALGCKKQLATPYVSVGRSRTDLALPHPKGIKKPGYGETTWAVIRFKNSVEARRIIVAADLEELEESGATIKLLPVNPSARPAAKEQENNARIYRAPQGEGRKDELTQMGVRILTGQRRR